jgi:hypothetical protein
MVFGLGCTAAVWQLDEQPVPTGTLELVEMNADADGHEPAVGRDGVDRRRALAEVR